MARGMSRAVLLGGQAVFLFAFENFPLIFFHFYASCENIFFELDKQALQGVNFAQVHRNKTDDADE